MCGIWPAGRSYEQIYPQKLGKVGVNIFLDFSTCISHYSSRLVSLCSGWSSSLRDLQQSDSMSRALPRFPCLERDGCAAVNITLLSPSLIASVDLWNTA